MRRLLGIVVGITLLVLPLATLLVLQLRFLAYQDQAVTWAQRVAVWLDVALVIALWPVIMDRGDSWRDYLQGRESLAPALENGARLGSGVGGCRCPRFRNDQRRLFRGARGDPGALLFLGMARALGSIKAMVARAKARTGSAAPAAAPMVRGMPGLLLVVALGVPLPLGLLADGEWWEEELLAGNALASEVVYDRFRRLDLSEQVLLAKPAKPELVAQFRKGDPEKVKEALEQVEPVKLGGRSLRGASFFVALLPGADLRDAQLQDANLWVAQLQGADLRGAQLQGANLGEANCRARICWSRAAGREFVESQAAGREFVWSRAAGRGFDRSGVARRGFANCSTIWRYCLQSDTALVDLRSARWTPLNEQQLAEMRELLSESSAPRNGEKIALDDIEHAANGGVPPHPRVLPDRPGSDTGAEMPAAVAACRDGSLPNEAFPRAGKARLPVVRDRAWPDSTN